MGWNGSTRKLTFGPFTKIAKNGNGDLQLALGTTKTEQIRVFTETYINPMATFKPFINSTPNFASDAARLTAREAARYGFGSSLPIYNLSAAAANPKNNWTYQRPDGRTNAQPLRTYDFYKGTVNGDPGYYPDAVCPLAVSVGNLTYSDESQILLFVNAMADTLRGSSGFWRIDESLSVEQLLKKPSDYYNHYISFLLIDTSDSGYTKNLVVTNMKMKDLVDSHYCAYTFILRGNEAAAVADYPKVPLLASSRSGHTIRIIACLMAGNNPSGTKKYAVYTPSTSPAVGTLTPYSLGFIDDCDRITKQLTSGAFNMDGTTMSSLVLTATDTAIEVTDGSGVWRAFMLSLTGTFGTGNVAYSGSMTISGNVVFSITAGAGKFGPAPSTADTPKTFGTAVSLVGSTNGQTKTIASIGDTNYLWVMKSGSSLISTTVKAAVTFDTPFSGSSQYLQGNVTKTPTI